MMNKRLIDFGINNLLLLTALLMIISGLAIQLGFHMGSHGSREPVEINKFSEQDRVIDELHTFWGLNYSQWSATHKVSIVLFSLLMFYHGQRHLKWYQAVISNHLFFKKNRQVIILTIIFLLVAITGLVPWFIDMAGGKNNLRLVFIELHDKLALLFILYMILHLIRKRKWFMATYNSLAKSHL